MHGALERICIINGGSCVHLININYSTLPVTQNVPILLLRSKFSWESPFLMDECDDVNMAYVLKGNCTRRVSFYMKMKGEIVKLQLSCRGGFIFNECVDML